MDNENIETIETNDDEILNDDEFISDEGNSLVSALVRKGAVLGAGILTGVGINYIKSHKDEWAGKLAERKEVKRQQKLAKLAKKMAELEAQAKPEVKEETEN